jgi:hypothetical protein
MLDHAGGFCCCCALLFLHCIHCWAWMALVGAHCIQAAIVAVVPPSGARCRWLNAGNAAPRGQAQSSAAG